MSREALDQWCERGIVVLAIALLVFLPLAFGGRPQPATGSFVDFLAGDPFIIAEWLTVGLALLWLARLWLGEGQRMLWPPVCWAVAAFSIYAVIRYLNADIEYVARQEMLQVLVYALLFLVFLNNLHKQDFTRLVVFTLIFLAMAISVYAVIQFITGSDRVWHIQTPYVRRATGTYISPNHLGGFLEMILPLALAYTLTGRMKPVARIVLGYSALVILAGIGVTMSRGTWVSTTLSLIVLLGMLLFQRSHRLPAILLLLVLGGFAAYSLTQNSFLSERLKQIVRQKATGAEGRTDLWPAAVQMWRENVWFGVGPAHFDYRFRQYRPEAVQARPGRAHNDFLNTLVDWGIVGLALTGSAWLVLAVGVFKTWRFVRGTPRDLGEGKKSNKFAFVLGASVGLVAILIHSTVDFNMHIPANAVIAVTLMALLASHIRFATERHWHGLGIPVKAMATIIISVGVGYIGLESARRAVENGALQGAELLPQLAPDRLAYLKQAFRADPKNSETALTLGEALRVRSEEGGSDYKVVGNEALTWYERSFKLNRWDPRPQLAYGRCLDWLDRKAESGPFFSRGEALDPNGYFTVATIGMHYVSLEDYAAARPWFERSLSLERDNGIATNYLAICQSRLLEAATNDLRLRLLGTPAKSEK